MNRATVRIHAPDATRLEAALAPDHEGHMTSRVEEGSLVLEAEAESIRGLLRTLDDALGCLRAAGVA